MIAVINRFPDRSRTSLSGVPTIGFKRRLLPGLALTASLLLSACGGGGSSSPAAFVPPRPQTGFTPGEFLAARTFEAQCTNPRAGGGFNDSQGNSTDENNWLRSWSNDLYLWYNEITDINPADFTTPEYFELMKTTATTSSGAPRDQFHFSLDSEEWARQSQSGISAGYGFDLALLRTTPPRDIVVAFVEPGSPASAAGVDLARGTRILRVDGRDAVNGGTQADVDALNNGLFPSDSGETHTFVVRDEGSSVERVVTIASAEITSDPVQNVKVIDTANGPVGYMTFNAHIATAEDELFDAFAQLEAASVSELVLDMRYNGGGFLILANQVASMIAGPSVAGQVFDETQFNDKHTARNPVTGNNLAPDPFLSTSPGLLGSSRGGQVLPALNLSRVYVLSGPGTCSASEAIINGLRGIDIEVVLIGGITCGKPYGFYPTDNCGTTYFSVQFRGVNAKNFGDYSDGFAPASLGPGSGTTIPGCFVADDFTKQLGDPLEARFAAAVAHMGDGSCPPVNGGISTNATAQSKSQRQSGAALSVPTRMPGAVKLR